MKSKAWISKTITRMMKLQWPEFFHKDHFKTCCASAYQKNHAIRGIAVFEKPSFEKTWSSWISILTGHNENGVALFEQRVNASP